MGSQVGGLNIDDDQTIQEAFKEVAKLNMPVAVHAEDRELLAANEEKLKQAKKIGTADFLRAHTEAVELKVIQRLPKTKRANRCAAAFLPCLNTRRLKRHC